MRYLLRKVKLYKPQPGTSWRHPKEEMMALIKNNEVWFGANGNSKPRRKKIFSRCEVWYNTADYMETC